MVVQYCAGSWVGLFSTVKFLLVSEYGGVVICRGFFEFLVSGDWGVVV
jgi:hypothetical protein